MVDLAKQFYKIPITLIKKYGAHIPFDLYLRLSDQKIVKISHKDENLTELFAKYEAKGVSEVYAYQEEYLSFLNTLKDQLAFKLFDPATTVEEQIGILSSSYEMVRETFLKLGINSAAVEVAKQITNSSFQIIKNAPNIFEFFLKYKNSCDSEYTKSILISYVCSCILGTFDWTSYSIKEKVSLAVMLRDVVLKPEDFPRLQLAMEEGKVKELNREIVEHPLKIAELLSKRNHATLTQEVLTIIEQHHELPDGTGFPRGINHQRITQLSSVQIIAEKFVTLMIEEKFNFKARDAILYKISTQYSQGNFKKSVNALYEALGAA